MGRVKPAVPASGLATVRRRLLWLALLPFLALLPALLLMLYTWGGNYFDHLLRFKVTSDLAVAHQYFNRVVDRVGEEVSALGGSHALLLAVESGHMDKLHVLLAERRVALGVDFIQFIDVHGRPLAAATKLDPRYRAADWPVVQSALSGRQKTAIALFPQAQLAAIDPTLAARARIELVATPNAMPTQRSEESRGMVIHTASPVYDEKGKLLGVLEGGVLLNQNLDFVDTINSIVYPQGSLPAGSDGTATLFIDDVRIATNVRLFGNKRALGTRASAAVRDHVLKGNKTWLDSAFVVHDWYISAYEPIHDSAGKPIGMLYVGYLEAPFRAAERQAIFLVVLLFVVICGGGVWLSLRLARSIYRPIQAMNRTMSAVEAGDLAARSGSGGGAEPNELGRLAGHLDQLLDTVQRQNEELTAWGNALDRKVAARTAELEAANTLLRDTQRQLALSEKLAAIGEITAGVAHEINNPVAVLQGNLDVLRDTLGAGTAAVEDELKLMDQQIQRINQMVTKLLQFASPTEYAGYIETLAVESLVADALVLLGPLLKKSGVQVVRHDTATHQVNVNRNELQQVLINLVTNAIHAMSGGGTLTLECCDMDADGVAGAAIRVSDTGSGIAPENLPRVFDAFFTTRAGSGTGLGLSISYTLVARYGGRITVTSAPGQGACFTVWLPAG